MRLRLENNLHFWGIGSIVRSYTSVLYRMLILWEYPLSCFCLSISVYVLLSWMITQRSLLLPSKVAYFNYLADAFLHGQFNLRVIPPSTHDLIFFQGNYFLYWPPFPAIVLMPLVAVFGVNFSDILFNILVAGLNTYLVAVVLRRAGELEIVNLSLGQRACLTAFFAIGTVHITLAPFGRVWSTGQLLGFLFLVLGLLSSLTVTGRKAFVLTGLALGATILTRTHMIFAGLWPAAYLIDRHGGLKSKDLVWNAVLLVAPIALACACLGIYNWQRFGSVHDNGLNYHQMAKEFASDYQRYGAFSLYYLPKNIFYQYIAYPLPLNDKTFYGGSLFLLSPVFLAAFWGIARGRPRWSMWLLVVSIVMVQVPILTLMGTGWVQFGPRYSLDFILPLLMLTAMGVRYWPSWGLALLTIVSVLQYLIGAAYFGAYLVSLGNL